MLLCNDNSYYVGHTDDIDKRMSQHYLGQENGYVAARLPAKLVFHQTFASRAEAIIAERKLKGWSHKKKQALAQYGFIGVQK